VGACEKVPCFSQSMRKECVETPSPPRQPRATLAVPLLPCSAALGSTAAASWCPVLITPDNTCNMESQRRFSRLKAVWPRRRFRPRQLEHAGHSPGTQPDSLCQDANRGGGGLILAGWLSADESPHLKIFAPNGGPCASVARTCLTASYRRATPACDDLCVAERTWAYCPCDGCICYLS